MGNVEKCCKGRGSISLLSEVLCELKFLSFLEQKTKLVRSELIWVLTEGPVPLVKDSKCVRS